MRIIDQKLVDTDYLRPDHLLIFSENLQQAGWVNQSPPVVLVGRTPEFIRVVASQSPVVFEGGNNELISYEFGGVMEFTLDLEGETSLKVFVGNTAFGVQFGNQQ